MFPGVRYTAILRTENEDGTGQTQLNITTPNAGEWRACVVYMLRPDCKPGPL